MMSGGAVGGSLAVWKCFVSEASVTEGGKFKMRTLDILFLMSTAAPLNSDKEKDEQGGYSIRVRFFDFKVSVRAHYLKETHL